MTFQRDFTMIALTVISAAGMYSIASDRNTTMIDPNSTFEN
ncbi:hypothetical protein ACN6BA_07225 [Bacillus altitudinis]|nr:hypothetical protein [Bacillus altitudinis]WHY06590.1 hypothetical protein QNH34_06040 [Bacillus altitudinis]WRO27165.1 hypothetical protein SA286_05920 [Bacillus altitudinis]